jgi:two-component sensor histidine kinase
MPGVPVHNVVPDKKGNIWFNTDRSIFQLNTKTGTITMLTEKDGFISKDFPNLFGGKDVDGDIYVGRDGAGFDRISPGKYVSEASSVYLESLKINQQTFPLSAGIDHSEKLSLKYFENNIDIETGIIDYYSSKSKGHIRYKLEADRKNASWQYAPAYSTIHYEGLQPGKYKLVLQSSNAANEFNGREKILMISISPAFWNTWWFRIVAVLFLIAIIYGVLRWRLLQRFRLKLERSEKEKQLADFGQKNAELQQQKIELEMQALRAQMNPHFIFNSLNSINRFILQNNRAQASEYLTKFSKLVRMILQNSQASLISLETELEALGLYLEMEALRFNYHFDYNITTSKELDVEVLQVPPLILQPYVENAIWHGLMHKEEKGQLNIDVRDEDDHLYFRITDNGIGRPKAAELASKSATKHKSMGLRITKDRIAMLEKTNGGESPVKIIDLENEDGSAAGTEVVIKMPAIYE